MADIKDFTPVSFGIGTTAEMQDIVDGLEACIDKLRKFNIIYGMPNVEKSERALLLGDVMYEAITNVLNNYSFESEEEFFLESEVLSEVKVEIDSDENCSAPNTNFSYLKKNDESSEANSSSESDYEPEDKKHRSNLVPVDIKRKVVDLWIKHPKWNLSALQSRGSRLLKNKRSLPKWRKQLENGGTKFDKYETISKHTFERFQEARNAGEQVTAKMIQEWGAKAAAEYQSDNFNFTASNSWVDKFKLKYGVSTRPIIRYVKSEKVQ